MDDLVFLPFYQEEDHVRDKNPGPRVAGGGGAGGVPGSGEKDGLTGYFQ